MFSNNAQRVAPPLLASFTGDSTGRSGDFALDLAKVFFLDPKFLLFRKTSGCIEAILGCPYESLAKRSLLSSPPSREGEAAVGANARRICFFADLRGIAEVVMTNQGGGYMQMTVMANAKVTTTQGKIDLSSAELFIGVAQDRVNGAREHVIGIEVNLINSFKGILTKF
jgi:hypothetical protein